MKKNYIAIKKRWLLVWCALLVSSSIVAQPTLKLQLTQPTYLCPSGFIAFNTIGGDGTPITYTATGVTLSSPNSNTGVVDQVKRINPNSGPVIIQATQSGDTTYSLAFDIHTYCAPSNAFLLPVLRSPIPDTILTINELNPLLNVGNYFRSNNIGYDYRASFKYRAYGIPPGMEFVGRAGLPPGTPGDTATAFIRGTPTTIGDYRVTVIATSQGAFTNAYSVADTFTIAVRATRPPTGTPFALTQPTYDCQTGAFQFNTSGGDNTLVEYYAVPGITRWTTNPNQFVDLETRTAIDAQPILLKARQNGKEITYLWDIRAVCPVNTTTFAITAVSTLNCQIVTATERQLTFNPQYSGVNGDAMRLSVVNEMVPTVAAGPYTLRVYTDNPVITLKAQQGSAMTSYTYNWLAVCNSLARVGIQDEGVGLGIKVLGNPVTGESADVEISGVSGQSVQLNLLTLQGKSLHVHRIEHAQAIERVYLPLGTTNGVLILQVNTPTQRQQVKLLKVP